MKTRILAGLAMIPLLVLVYFGGWFLAVPVFAAMVIGLREFYKGFEAKEVKPSYVIGYVSIGLLLILYFAMKFFTFDFGTSYLFLAMWGVIVIMMSMIYGFKVSERKLEDMTATLMGIFYVCFMLFHLLFIDGFFPYIIWLVFIIAFGTDICAYFSGMFLGKHKLCPELSPKKTVEGAIGGVLGSTILSLAFGYFYLIQHLDMSWGLALTIILSLSILGSVISQLGDLAASAFKRQMEIKDYGNLIPGHGGILDRFDSVIFVAPFVFYGMYIILLIYMVIYQ